MDVLGIDPSLTMTGVASWERGVTAAHRFPTAPASGLFETRERIRYIVGSVMKWAPERCLTVIEKPFVPHRGGAGQVLERAWLYGLLVDQLLLRGPVVGVTAKGRAKYGAGSGNADKAAVQAAMREAFPALPVRDSNEADALVLVAMGARFLGSPIDGDPSKAQLQAMTAVSWPTHMKEMK